MKMNVHEELNDLLRIIFARYAALEPSDTGGSGTSGDQANTGRKSILLNLIRRSG